MWRITKIIIMMKIFIRFLYLCNSKIPLEFLNSEISFRRNCLIKLKSSLHKLTKVYKNGTKLRVLGMIAIFFFVVFEGQIHNLVETNVVVVSFLVSHLSLVRVRNSFLVLGSSLKPPSMHEVTVLELIFCTPLMTMHMWLASTTTPTPTGEMASTTAIAISLVRRS